MQKHPSEVEVAATIVSSRSKAPGIRCNLHHSRLDPVAMQHNRVIVDIDDAEAVQPRRRFNDALMLHGARQHDSKGVTRRNR